VGRTNLADDTPDEDVLLRLAALALAGLGNLGDLLKVAAGVEAVTNCGKGCNARSQHSARFGARSSSSTRSSSTCWDTGGSSDEPQMGGAGRTSALLDCHLCERDGKECEMLGPGLSRRVLPFRGAVP
jgi:hypothetical protein